jgi:hypothetical protein
MFTLYKQYDNCTVIKKWKDSDNPKQIKNDKSIVYKNHYIPLVKL